MTFDSASANEFARHARNFVEWCNLKHSEESDEAFRKEALRLIAMLYATGCSLTEVAFVNSPDFPDLSKSRLDSVAANLARLPFRNYWSVFTPSEIVEEKPGCGDLLDDFLDMYRDMHDGLLLFDAGHTQAAAYHWNQMFFHWGHHAVDALSALHSYDPKSNYTF